MVIQSYILKDYFRVFETPYYTVQVSVHFFLYSNITEPGRVCALVMSKYRGI